MNMPPSVDNKTLVKLMNKQIIKLAGRDNDESLDIEELLVENINLRLKLAEKRPKMTKRQFIKTFLMRNPQLKKADKRVRLLKFIVLASPKPLSKQILEKEIPTKSLKSLVRDTNNSIKNCLPNHVLLIRNDRQTKKGYYLEIAPKKINTA
jgi:hypothetical protein